ncbi:MAG: hypothetical protein P4M05_33415 [Bradyrhizobium sp.]|jgi:hypothetical protein|nr:hypothetical protein [Bradyrhizobium sp.]
MDKFLYDENLKLLHKRLMETTDEKQRRVLQNLIAEHEANYREWQLGSRLA